MSKCRVIARLDIKGPNLVKGIHLEGLRVLGTPEDYAELYYNQGIDELFYMDVVASLYERNSLSELVTRTARKTFIPLTVGGGIRTLNDIKTALRAGADKVAINTGAIKNPSFIKSAAEKFGSSTIVATIECIKQPDGRYLAFMDNAREETGLEALNWAERLVELGAGELVLTSVDNEGTGNGCDLELIKMISSAVNVPIVAHGGVGSPSDAVAAIQAGADAIAIASVLHYQALQAGLVKREASKEEGNTRFLTENRVFKKITPTTISDIKSAFRTSGIAVRDLK